MQNFEANSSVRSQILLALEMLISGENITEANATIQRLHAEFNNRETIFSLNSIVFHFFTSAALDSEYRSSKLMLMDLRDELIGKRSHWQTFALKFNFAETFNPECRQVFNQIQEFVRLLENRLWHEQAAHFETLHERLHEFVYEVLIPQNVAELMLSLLIHTAIELPTLYQFSRLDSFDAAAGGFSSILPPETMPDTFERHIPYLQALAQKLKGEEIAYVDVTIRGELVMVNIR